MAVWYPGGGEGCRGNPGVIHLVTAIIIIIIIINDIYIAQIRKFSKCAISS